MLPAGPLKEKVVRLYTRQVVTGLEYLHGHHIMHRDIKGANILVDNAGKVKLADFGASKKIESLVTVGKETCNEVCPTCLPCSALNRRSAGTYLQQQPQRL